MASTGLVLQGCKWKVRSSPLPRESMRTAIYDGLCFTAMS
ncbi:MFS transporter (plasmid) [Mesorhizobium sp. AR07]|nr:MFS transporter [Mesorhizobium sp. AR07]